MGWGKGRELLHWMNWLFPKKIYNVKNGWKIEMLPELSAMVERYSGIFNANHKPIVGKNVFSHKAGVHTSAVLKNPLTYEFLRPEEFGRKGQYSWTNLQGLLQ